MSDLHEQKIKNTPQGNPASELRTLKSTNVVGPAKICPKCREGKLEYDGCLNLVCTHCGYVLGGGGFT